MATPNATANMQNVITEAGRTRHKRAPERAYALCGALAYIVCEPGTPNERAMAWKVCAKCLKESNN